MKSFRLSLFLRTLSLPAVTLLAPLSAWADTTISSDFTQNGGTFTVTPPTLLVTHGSNDPTLTLTNGASASWEGATIIGNLSGESGNLEILNGSTLTNSGSNFIGTYGFMGIFSGEGYIGLNFLSTGTVLVSGTDSTWTNNNLIVGHRGTGTLRVEAGGAVSNGNGFIGYTNVSQGSVTVTGPGSTWTNSAQLFVGEFGTGALLVEAGGAVSNNGVGAIGYDWSSQGSVTVTGTGSTWTNSIQLFVGRMGSSNNTLTIQDGALVRVGGSLLISRGGGDNNYIRLDGGYIALFGDQTTNITSFIEDGYFQLWDGASWVTSTGITNYEFGYFATNEAAEAFSGYQNLGGYTILTAGAIPEPSTALLLALGLGSLLLRRKTRNA